MFCANRLCVFPFSHDLCVYFLRLLFLLCIFLSFLCISNTTQCYSFTIQPKVNNLNTISSLPPPILSFILENNVRGDCNENTNCVQKCDHGNKKTVNAHWTDAEGDLISEDQGEPSDLHFYLHPSQQHHFTSDPHMSEDRTFFFFFPEGPHAQYADSSTPEASDGQWPHQASFQHRGQQRCSTGHANTP